MQLLDRLVAPAAVFSSDGMSSVRNEAMVALLSQSAFAAELEEEMAQLACTLSGVALGLSRAEVRQWVGRQRAHSFVIGGVRISGSIVETARPRRGTAILVTAADERANYPSNLSAARVLAVLSPREREVALLLAAGSSNRATAGVLGITEHTARRHTEGVLRRLGLTSRQQVASRLLQNG